MRKDLVIIPDDKPGVLARLGECLGEAGVNIEACSAFTGGGKGVVHLLVDDADEAVHALAEAGFDVKAARRVAVMKLDNAPGALGAACRALADADVNVEQAYFANDNQLVLVCDDIDKAKDVLDME